MSCLRIDLIKDEAPTPVPSTMQKRESLCSKEIDAGTNSFAKCGFGRLAALESTQAPMPPVCGQPDDLPEFAFCPSVAVSSAPSATFDSKAGACSRGMNRIGSKEQHPRRNSNSREDLIRPTLSVNETGVFGNKAIRTEAEPKANISCSEESSDMVLKQRAFAVGTRAGSAQDASTASVDKRMPRNHQFVRRRKETPWWESSGESVVSAKSGISTETPTSLQSSDSTWIPQAKAWECPAVIIFDFDDTLMATTFIQQVILPGVSHQGLYTCGLDSPHYASLAAHAQVVKHVLEEARRVSRVAIVTLASPWWFRTSAENYYPGLDFEGLLKELDIPVYFADRESHLVRAMANAGKDPSLAAKQVAMSSTLKRFYNLSDESCPHWNVLSIGDSTVEREALKECIEKECKSNLSSGVEVQRLCKTVKLREAPSLEQLTQELKDLVPSIPHLIKHDKDLDRTTVASGMTRRRSWPIAGFLRG